VLPHLDAVFTIRSFFPLNFLKSILPPSSDSTLNLYIGDVFLVGEKKDDNRMMPASKNILFIKFYLI
jgi:hypothetical protein